LWDLEVIAVWSFNEGTPSNKLGSEKEMEPGASSMCKA